MTDALALLWGPFLVAICLVGIHAYFGIQVLSRGVIFVDLALAQVAALGATVAFALGHPAQSFATYAYSLGFALAAALVLTATRVWSTRLPQEALIGVLYVVAAAAAVLLIDRAPQGAEHLKQSLTGNILTTGFADVTAVAPLYLLVGGAHALLRRRLTALPWLADFAFYGAFAVVVTSSVAIAGVFLVFAFLIIPAMIGVLYAETPARQLTIAWPAGVAASAIGLAVSYALDLPTGATMVCIFGAALIVAAALKPVVAHGVGHASTRLATALRWSVSALLVASGVLLVAFPRADQPLLDAAEHLVPSIRAAYLTRSEAATYADAQHYAARYLAEAEKLNDAELRSRAEREGLDDAQIRKLSSFVRSYGEMRKGEEFVMREVRSRARERVGRIIGGAAVILGFAFAPGLPGRLRDVRRIVSNRMRRHGPIP